ncbi:MAG: DUF4435 domain-containing protein [Muribaculaceae bacterium]|nr:DUF4435 domain-containing protein [Muribaculaceae bacterium]
MDINLPKKPDGTTEHLLSGENRLVTIIGANGAGKSRFTSNVISNLDPNHTYRISALSAFYVSDKPDTLPRSIDSQYAAIIEKSSILRDSAVKNFDRMIAILINEELLNLMAYKVDSFGETPTKPLPPTRLDTLITKWQEIFPDNKVLHRQGKLIFTRRDDKDEYSTTRLSMGEKAVLYYIGATILAPKNAVIFVDNPAEFLHPSIQHIVWDTVEELRRDCSFIYTTHDLDFASTRSENTTIWVRSYDPATTTWDYCVLPPHSTLSDDIYISILGERKPVLFIEGDETHSIDAKLYPLIFRRFAVKPLGSCDKVIEAVRSFNDLKAFHNTDSYGIVDRDRRNDEEVESLRRRKIFVPDVAEIENILMLEEVIKAVARTHRRNPEKAFEEVKEKIVNLFRQQVEAQIIEHTRHRVKRITQTVIDHKADDIEGIKSYISNLNAIIKPDEIYNDISGKFRYYAQKGDYQSILRVFNHKQMIYQSNVAYLTGVNDRGHAKSRNRYINAIIRILKSNDENAHIIRKAIERCFQLNID